MPPSLLARAVNMLEEVWISGTELTVKQLEAILIDICKGQSSLKELDIAGNNLTVEQVEAICAAICEGDCKAKVLDIGLENLSRVNPDLLARAVVKLEYMELDYTMFTKQQKDAIFATIIKGDSWLKKLNLSSKNLITLSPSLIDSAVSVNMVRKVTAKWWKKRQRKLEYFVVFLELMVILFLGYC